MKIFKKYETACRNGVIIPAVLNDAPVYLSDLPSPWFVIERVRFRKLHDAGTREISLVRLTQKYWAVLIKSSPVLGQTPVFLFTKATEATKYYHDKVACYDKHMAWRR